QLRKEKVEMLKEIYRMLVINMGIPPKSFEWRYTNEDDSLIIERHTPMSFFKDVVGMNMSNYVCFCNCPINEYNKLYQIKLARGAWDGTDWKYINLEMDKIKEFAYKALMDTIPVEFSVDMGHEVYSKGGYMFFDVYDYSAIYGIDFKFSKSIGVLMRESLPNHSMMLVGVDTDVEGGPMKWRIENSWGSDRGEDGFFAMSDQWFDQYGYSIVINKKYVPEDILKILDTKPVILPGWDPLARIVSIDGYYD
ncbi:MAG: aminopeptidase, partial [FCB group bacterium]|nr:aminopeptidase [FCB group bacterium]